MRSSIPKKTASAVKLAELIFFPSECELCSRLLVYPDEKVVCRTCLQRVEPRRTSYCLCCGRFFDSSAEPHFCSECIHQKPAFSVHRSCGSYEGKLKDLIILYKYRKFRILGKPLAQFAHKTLSREENLWWGVDAVVAVPLHPVKKRRRGFNQAHFIARELAAFRGVELLRGELIKVRNTSPQTSLEAKERVRNLKEAFQVREPDKIRGKIILLVDDVFTTGSTIQECSLTLKKAGAKEVRGLTLAQA